MFYIVTVQRSFPVGPFDTEAEAEAYRDANHADGKVVPASQVE